MLFRRESSGDSVREHWAAPAFPCSSLSGFSSLIQCFVIFSAVRGASIKGAGSRVSSTPKAPRRAGSGATEKRVFLLWGFKRFHWPIRRSRPCEGTLLRGLFTYLASICRHTLKISRTSLWSHLRNSHIFICCLLRREHQPMGEPDLETTSLESKSSRNLNQKKLPTSQSPISCINLIDLQLGATGNLGKWTLSMNICKWFVFPQENARHILGHLSTS